MAAEKTANQFAPDYSIHPGEILEETLTSRSISHKELAERTGLSMKTVSLITNGKAPITSETAIHLERALGVSARLWSNLDANYRLSQAKESLHEQMKKHSGWLKRFPKDVLISLEITSTRADPVESVDRLLAFFGVSSPDAWENRYSKQAVNFRKTKAFSSSWESVTCWLRLSEIEADGINTMPFTMDSFRKALTKIREMTILPAESFQNKMKNLCADSGVALTFIPELPKTRLCGATLWLTPEKALLSLSLRYKSDDQFWFSFFHEAGHIVLHGKRDVFFEERGLGGSQQENEADEYAKKVLFPDKSYEAFVARSRFYEADIVEFAKSINLAPGIVVGALQHDKYIKYEWHNRLKKRFAFATNISS
jgi:HTH-type transcriptional regulator / antitoxin HigA